MLSVYSEKDERALEAFKLGVDGYLNKSCTPSDILSAVERIVSGQSCFTIGFMEHVTHCLMARKKPSHECLAEQEYKVFCMLAQGRPIRKISKELNLSQSTVSTYKQRIFEKMEFKSNADMFRYAVKKKLTDLG
jgi:two-component system invasion response regulator UvrY